MLTHTFASRLLGQRLCDSMRVSVQQRIQSCGRTAGDIVSTAVGIIQYREGTLHRLLISVLLYSDLKTPVCLFLVLPDEVLQNRASANEF